MRFFVTIFVLFAVATLCVEAGDHSALIKSMSGDCKKQEKASDDDVENLSNLKVPTTPEGKCLTACMGKQFGIIKDNKLSKAGFAGKAAMIIGTDPEKKRKVDEIGDACADATNDERCEAASVIWNCIENESKKRGLELF